MIPMQPIPVDSFLVPARQPALPDGFTSARQDLTNGLPFTWSIASDLSLVLLASVGDIGAALLAGDQCLFLCVSPRSRTNTQTAE